MKFKRIPGPLEPLPFPSNFDAYVHDSTGNQIDSTDKALHVLPQDQTTPPIDLFFQQALGPPTTLAVATALNDKTVTVTSAAGFTVGDTLGLFEGGTSDRFYFGEVLNIAANVLTVDNPLDFVFSVGSNALPLSRDLNVDGSITPQIFEVQGGGATTGLSIDVTRIIIQMETDGQIDLNKFGDITGGITNGIVFRTVNGDYRNIYNAKTNFDIAVFGYDFEIYTASNPAQGVNGLNARITFAGMNKHGVAIRLEPGEALECVIQDDLTAIDKFRIIAQGHEVN